MPIIDLNYKQSYHCIENAKLQYTQSLSVLRRRAEHLHLAKLIQKMLDWLISAEKGQTHQNTTLERSPLLSIGIS